MIPKFIHESCIMGTVISALSPWQRIKALFLPFPQTRFCFSLTQRRYCWEKREVGTVATGKDKKQQTLALECPKAQV